MQPMIKGKESCSTRLMKEVFVQHANFSAKTRTSYIGQIFYHKATKSQSLTQNGVKLKKKKTGSLSSIDTFHSILSQVHGLL